METFTDEDIEGAFGRIRADFEARGNEDGLTMLDGFEDAWARYGGLTDGQLAWLERQLDGSWRRAARRPGATGRDAGRVPSTSQRSGRPTDAAVRERLREQGQTAVEIERLRELEEVVDELRRAVRALG